MKQRKSYQQHLIIDFCGESLDVIITASKRKSIRLQVTQDRKIDLRVPDHSSKTDVFMFLQSHHDWLKQRLEVAKERQSLKERSISLLGVDRPYSASNQVSSLKISEYAILVPESWSIQQRDKAMEQWLRKEAKHLYQEMIDQWWPEFQKYASTQPTLRVKKMKTRWGSLSSKGYINLNLSLMALPMDLIELVVVHELCHLKHFDHGAGFKSLLADCLPDWTEREKRLKALENQVL